jgi:dTDP-4-amino-4,6-dideoxygalactose transaminase
MGKINFVDLKTSFQSVKEEIHKAIDEVTESQYFILGPKVEEFEKNVASYCQAKHAVGCASGTDALILALAAAGVGENDEVITTPFSFFSTASSITKVGAKPVFIDIEPGTFNIDPMIIEAAITLRTRAIIPVHLYGQMAAMNSIMEIAEKKNLAVIEDACQSLGTEYFREGSGKWKKAGTFGDMGCFSFFPTKNLGGFGDGGMVITDDDSLAEKLKLLRVHGSEKKYFHKWIGWNSRLDALQAAVLNVKLKYLDRWSSERKENADRYDALFKESKLIDSEAVVIPERFQKSTHIFNQYTVRAKNRDALRDFLSSKEIGTEIYYPVPLHLQECFASLKYKKNDFPISEKASEDVLSLPIYPGLPPEDQETVVSAIKDFYNA